MKRVMAFYYMWYWTKFYSGFYRGWNYLGHKPAKGDSCTANHPLKFYDSNDTKVIINHLKIAKESGIDTLIASWWGYKSNFSKPFDKLLKLAEKSGVSIAPYIEVFKDHLESAIDELDNFLDDYSKSKSLLKIKNKPLLFIYGKALSQFDYSDWKLIINKFKDRALFIADTNDKSLLNLFDGAHNYSPFNAIIRNVKPIDYYGGIINACKKSGKISCFTVTPGYDDRVLKRKHSIKYWIWRFLNLKLSEFYIPRFNGFTYKSLWDQALALKPDYVLITSFNEWHEGTEIEPSKEYGDYYLRLTKEYSDRFKKSI